MMAKTQIVDFLGEDALVLPALLATALVANDRAKYVLTLLQMAASQAESPQVPAPSMRAEREACGITETGFDRAIALAEYDNSGNYHIPGAKRLIAALDEALAAMIAPLGVAAKESAEAASLAARFKDRLDKLIQARPPIADDVLSGETIASMTSGSPKAGDGFHVLVMDLHKEINRLQGVISTMNVAGAKAYGLNDADRARVAAFMAGVNRTAPLKFEHPGLDTIAVRANEALLIQNDIGTTAAHVLIVKVTGLHVAVTHTDVHLQRLRFLQTLCGEIGIKWKDIRSRQAPGILDDDLFYQAAGEYDAANAGDLARLSRPARIAHRLSHRLEQGAQAARAAGSERDRDRHPQMGGRSRGRSPGISQARRRAADLRRAGAGGEDAVAPRPEAQRDDRPRRGEGVSPLRPPDHRDRAVAGPVGGAHPRPGSRRIVHAFPFGRAAFAGRLRQPRRDHRAARNRPARGFPARAATNAARPSPSTPSAPSSGKAAPTTWSTRCGRRFIAFRARISSARSSKPPTTPRIIWRMRLRLPAHPADGPHRREGHHHRHPLPHRLRRDT